MKRGIGGSWFLLGSMLAAVLTASCGKAERHGADGNATGTATDSGTGTATTTRTATSTSSGTGVGVEPDCSPWRPKGGAWTSLPTPRPANLSSVQASADGKFLYAVGKWVEDGAVVSGVLRSKDLGATWCEAGSLPGVFHVAPASANAATIFALGSDTASGQVFVARSSAHGTSWEISSTFANLDADSRLVPMVNDAGSLWLVGSEQLFISRDGAASFGELALPSALAPLWSGMLESATLLGIFPHPASAERVLVSGWLHESSPRSEALARFFTTADGGATWREITDVPPLGSEPPRPTVVVDARGRAHLAAVEKLYESTDFGDHWSEVTSPATYVQLVDLDTHRGDALFAWRLAPPPLSRSTDGGRSWRQIPTPDSFFFPLYADPLRPGAIVGELKGRWIATENFGETWTFGDLAPRPNELYSSPTKGKLWASPPGARSSDGGISWSPADVGDSGWDGAGARMLADGKDLNVLFVFREEQPLRRSEDAGDTWADIALPTGASWPHGAATCKSPHSCLYVLYTQGGRQTIARSDDHGQSWAELNVLPPSMLPSAPKAMLVAYDSTGHLFIPAGGRELAESRDGGRSWISLTTPETTAISELAILPDGTLLLAGSMGLPPGAQFRSTDSGNTWQRMAEGGAEFFVSYSRPTTVFASNWDGLRRSDDSGETWTAISPPGLRLAQGMAEVAEGKFVVPVSGFGLVAFE